MLVMCGTDGGRCRQCGGKSKYCCKILIGEPLISVALEAYAISLLKCVIFTACYDVVCLYSFTGYSACYTGVL